MTREEKYEITEYVLLLLANATESRDLHATISAALAQQRSGQQPLHRGHKTCETRGCYGDHGGQRCAEDNTAHKDTDANVCLCYAPQEHKR